MARILFVEDETEVLGTLLKYFEKQGYSVHGAQTGEEAMALMERFPPDVAVLDVMLQEGPAGPDGMNGFEICKALRDSGFDRPVLFLTARTSEEDKIVAFDAGADNYITKPFSLPVLEKRIEALLRRVGGARYLYHYGDVRVELGPNDLAIHHPDGDEPLSKREAALLKFFIDNKGRILPRDVLLERVWGYRAGVATRTVDTHVLTVRKKLRDDAQSPRFIRTLHGVGYQFIGEEG
jgi:two-component system alkaline phosphatase synthesis response regulator PhoP